MEKQVHNPEAEYWRDFSYQVCINSRYKKRLKETIRYTKMLKNQAPDNRNVTPIYGNIRQVTTSYKNGRNCLITRRPKVQVLPPQPRNQNRPSGDFFGLCKLRAKKYHDLQGNCSDNDTFLNDPGDSGVKSEFVCKLP